MKKYIDGSLLIREDESKATVNSKHFVANNGTEKVIVSSEAIHFYDEEKKKWRDVDNSLQETEGGYSAKLGKYKANLSNGEHSEKVEVIGKSNSVSWEYLGTKRPDEIGIGDNPVIKKRKRKAKIESRLPGQFCGASSKVIYEESDGKIDLEYIVKENSIKENIIVKEKAKEYKYYYALKIKGFEIRLSEDNKCIELYAKDNNSVNETPEFVMPEPYMVDGDGMVSNDVYYELEELEEDVYLFSVEANSDWINSIKRILPITIDPQIQEFKVSGLSGAIEANTLTVYSDGGTFDSCGNYIQGSNYINTSNEIHVFKSDYMTKTATVSIDCSKLGFSTENLISAKLVLKSSLEFLDRMFYINGGIVNERGTELEVDITTNVINKGSVTIELTPYQYGCDVYFSYSGSNAPYIVLEYQMEDGYKDKKHIIPIIDNIFGEYNLETEEFVIGFDDISDPILDVGISHLFKDSDSNYHCGNNFRLNINETLKKTADTSTGEKYVYTDPMGKVHSFKERFYYLGENNTKTEIDTVDDTHVLHVDVDGTLWYDVYSDGEVTESHKSYRELYTPEGLSASARLEGVKNAQWFEQRSEDEKKLEEQLKGYEDAILEFVGINNATESIWKSMSNVSDVDNFLSRYNDVLTKEEALQLQSLYLQKQKYQTEYLDLNLSKTQILKSISDLEAKTSLSTDEQSVLNNLNLEHDILVAKTNENNRQREIINSQIGYYVKKASQSSELLRTYYKEYLAIKSQLEALKAQMPVSYLIADKSIKGFNSDGELVVIYNKYGNYIVVEREKITSDGKQVISCISDKNNERRITFEYDEDGQLVCIINTIGDRVNYTYSSGNLSKIERSDGKSYAIYYNDGKISAINSETHRANINYSGDTFSKASLTALMSSVTNGNETFAETEISSVLLSHGNELVSISGVKTPVTYVSFKNKRGEETRYIYNPGVEYVGCCEIIGGKVASFVKEEYEAYSHYKKRATKPAFLNCSEFSDFDFGSNAVNEEITYNRFNDPVKKIIDWTPIAGNTSQKTEINYTYDNNRRLIETITPISTKEKGVIIDEATEITKYFYNSAGDIVRTESYIEGEEYTSGVNVEENVYNNRGVKIKSLSYNSLDSTSKFYTEHEVDENGKLLSELDWTGEHKTSFEYEADGVTVRSKTLPNGSKLVYGKGRRGEVTGISHSTCDGEGNSTERVYTHGLVTQVKSGNNATEYHYDAKGRVISVKLNGVEDYIIYQYSGDNTAEETTEATLKDGTTFTVVKDERGNVIKSTCNGVEVTNTYNQWNKISSARSSDGERVYMSYNSLGDPTIVAVNGENKEIFAYDSYGKISSKTVHGREYSYSYKDTAEKELDSIEIEGIIVKPKLDINGRNVGKSIEINGQIKTEEHISYLKFGDHSTMLPSAIRYGTLNNSGYSIKDSLKYRYDPMGNICEVVENGLTVASYEYDTLGRLVREDNRKLAKTSVYTYDNNGNVLSRYEYNLTNETTHELKLTTPISSFIYEYANENTDKLVSFAGESFTYDVIGNPTTYRGKSATWTNGRELISYDGNTYTYDAWGRRTSKKNADNNAITFTYDSNGNLISQSDGLDFLYDHTGVFAVIYDDKTYFYRKNAQGDIIALLDNEGHIVVKYTYDAWGTCVTEVFDTAANEIATLNPFRYRSYYLDTETGLYFLKTRYYDPEIGRFMTIDDISYLNPDTINGLNLYAYCGNNPVMNVDPKGTEWWHWLISGVEVVAGVYFCFVPGAQAFGVTLISIGAGAIINGYITESNGGTLNAGWWGGQVAGFFSIIPGVGNALGAFAGSIVTDYLDLGIDNIDIGKAVWSGVLSWAITLFPAMIGEIACKSGIKDASVYFVNAYNSIITSIANSIVNVYWRGKNE